MLKKRLYLVICMLLALLVTFVSAALHQAKKIHRDPVVLMNKYYQFKNDNPEAARKSLLIILKQDDSYLPALIEYSQWSIRDNNTQQAIHSLERLHELLPENYTYTFQLGYLYYMNGEWQKSQLIYIRLLEHVTGVLKVKAQQALNAMASYLPYYQYHANVEMFVVASNTASKPTNLAPLKYVQPLSVNKGWNDATKQISLQMNHYYALKAKDQNSAQHFIKIVIKKHPNNVQALKEAGFLAIAQGHQIEAINYFSRAYNLTYQPEIAMQLAYLYDQINDKPMAFQYLKLAAQSHDKNLSLSAENAMTNLRGLQTKALPRPYYSEIFFDPFYESRFGLTVVPFIWRLGFEQDNRFQTKEYVFLRRTQDNRSANFGQISQIYEDNVQITGVGGQIAPFKRLPIIGYVEVGAAYDLLYQNRNRWRGDLRGGLMYYQDFGKRPAYFDTLKIGHDYYSDWYADATYFSRYNNNIIGLIKTHQGIRLLQYKSSMLNLYMTGRVFGDTRREFFNNYAEVGPGISFIPSNRFNLELRFEHVDGVYLPAGASFNPYGKHYTSQYAQLLFYVKI